MFNGFSERTIEFFMAIRFNNNAAFFHDNHDWYEEAVRAPMKALAASLAPTVEEIDPLLERRPERVVSRINRDIRFSRNKSPYHDDMWLSFHRTGEEKSTSMGLYFDISDTRLSCGMGIYRENRPLMNGMRRSLRQDGGVALREALRPAHEFALHGEIFKRMSPPDGLTDEAFVWYPFRRFYLEKTLPRELAFSPALAGETARGFQALAPLYTWFSHITPVENDEP